MAQLSLRDFLDNAEGVRASGRVVAAADGVRAGRTLAAFDAVRLDGAEGSRASAADPRPGRFHRSMPGYRPSAVAEAPGVAEHLGLERLVVKMEVERFGLPAFKLLGASWAVCRAVCAHAGLAEPVATFDELRSLAAEQGDLELGTATDGNHGRAVAHMARLIGLRARILVPAGTAAARIDAIAGEGADVEVVPGSYDEAVELAARRAGAEHLVISDTSWPGYEDVPGWVADGYATIFEELAEQLREAPRPGGVPRPGETPPTGEASPPGGVPRLGPLPQLVAVQIGVGALASAAVRALARPGRVLVGVEPVDAACVIAAVRGGAPVLVEGPHGSVMAGLNCGLASQIALPDMAQGIAAFCSIDDRAAESAVRMLYADGLSCGETGASGVAGLLALRERWPQDTWERLGLPARPSALAICTEAPTDPASFARITGAA